MSKKNRRTMGVDDKFPEFLDEIRFDRFKKGLDVRPVSQRRLTLALTRVPKLKEVLLTAEIEGELNLRKRKKKK